MNREAPGGRTSPAGTTAEQFGTTAARPRAVAAPGRRYLLGGTCSGFLLNGLIFAIIGPTLPAIADTFHVSLASAGILFSAQSFGYLAAVFVAGIVSAVIGNRRPVLVGVGSTAVLLFAFALAPIWPLAIALMVCVGVFFGLAEITITASIADAFPDRRGWSLNMLHLFFGIGAFVSPLLVGITSHWSTNWRILYVSVAGFGIVSFLFLTRIRFPRVRHTHTARVRATLWFLLRQRRFLMLGTILALAVGGEATVAGWCFSYLVKYRGQSEGYAGLVLSLFWVGLVLGRLMSTAIVERAHYGLLILATGIAACAVVMLTLITSQAVLMALGFALSGFFFAPLFATTMALAQRTYPQSPALVAGLITTISGIGSALFPWLAGQISAWTSLRYSVMFGGLMSLALAAVISIILLEDRLGLCHKVALGSSGKPDARSHV